MKSAVNMSTQCKGNRWMIIEISITDPIVGVPQPGIEARPWRWECRILNAVVSWSSWSSLGRGFKVSSPMYLQKCNLTLLYSWPNMNKCSHSLRVCLHMFTLELCVSALILFQMWPMVPKLRDYLPSNSRHHTIRKTMAAVPNVRVAQTRQKMEMSRIAIES